MGPLTRWVLDSALAQCAAWRAGGRDAVSVNVSANLLQEGVAGLVSRLLLVRATIELGHAMGLRVVTEGIEDAEALRLLTELGCDLAQGYYIGRPKPADELVLPAVSSRLRPRSRQQAGGDAFAA